MLTDTRLPLVLAALLAALPAAVRAQPAGETTENDFALSCAFVQECYETEPCAATDHALSVTGRVGGLGAGAVLVRATLGTVSGDVQSFGTRDGATLFLQGGAGRTRHYLTVTDGAARYSVHMGQGPAAVSYFGTCQ